MSQFIVVDGINTTLTDAVTTTDTSITLASSPNLPALLAGQILPLIVQSASNASAYEIMYGTAISGAEITVTRGMEGTTAQAFNVGDYVLCGPTAGSNALIRAVMNPATSQTLPQAYGAAVFPTGLSGAITLTLPNAVPAGTSYVIYGNASYAVTVATSVVSGSPFIALPDGSQIYSWTIPAGTGQGMRIDFDGTNCRAQTFGQTVVAPAAAGNQALPLGQAFQLIKPTVSATITPTALRTAVLPSVSLSAAITITIEPGTVQGQEIEVFGGGPYAVTVVPNVASGSPYFVFPDESQSYSWSLPGGYYDQSIKLIWDNSNWRCTTAGQTVVAPATQSNAATQLSQLFIGNRKAVFTANGSYTVPNAVTTIWVSGAGAGGGGGGGNKLSSTNQGAGGGSGFSGGIAIKQAISVTPGDVLTVSIGAGGSGGAGVLSFETAGNGSTGGNTTLSNGSTTLLSIAGGDNGSGAGAISGGYALGGGGFNPGILSVATGTASLDYGNQIGFGGSGQSNPFGLGGSGGNSGNDGASGENGAGGGGGGGNTGSGSSNGGAGGNGILIIEW